MARSGVAVGLSLVAFCAAIAFTSSRACATNFLLQRQSGGGASSNHSLNGEFDGDSGSTGASSEGSVEVSNVDTGGSGTMLSQEETNLYTAVGNTSGAPQANAAAQLIGGVTVNTPPSGINFLTGDSTAFGSATYEIVDCPQTNALIIGYISLYADPTTNSNWIDGLLTSVSATVGGSNVVANNLVGSWDVQGFVSDVADPSGGTDVSGTYLGSLFAEDFTCSEYSTCGSSVPISVFATVHLEYATDVMTTEIVESNAHADFSVVTY